MNTKNPAQKSENSGMRLTDDGTNILLREDFRYSSLLKVKASIQTIIERRMKSRSGQALISANFVTENEDGEIAIDSITIDDREIKEDSPIAHEVFSIAEEVLSHYELEEGEEINLEISVLYSDGYAEEVAVSIEESPEHEEEEDDSDEEEDEDSRENPDDEEELDDSDEEEEDDSDEEEDEDSRENPDDEEELDDSDEEEEEQPRKNSRRLNFTESVFPAKGKKRK